MTMTEFTPLDVDDMMAAYRHSKSRVILLDYGGSLLEKEVRFVSVCLDVEEARLGATSYSSARSTVPVLALVRALVRVVGGFLDVEVVVWMGVPEKDST